MRIEPTLTGVLFEDDMATIEFSVDEGRIYVEDVRIMNIDVISAIGVSDMRLMERTIEKHLEAQKRNVLL